MIPNSMWAYLKTVEFRSSKLVTILGPFAADMCRRGRTMLMEMWVESRQFADEWLLCMPWLGNSAINVSAKIFMPLASG